ncbi:MAG: N-acetyl-gamma-glutamyl-phosphate reductase [Desulfitobacteriaceae bacterium]|nr:N-acetyl-gamma-glutamyl-phosphate reductase [Desulfitobacteriaceae bacterium]
MIKASVIGATGYAGAEVVRLLALHPEVELVYLTSQSYIGQQIDDVYPHLKGFVNNVLVEQETEKIAESSDVVFVALPHGHAVSTGEAVVKAGKKVIDLGADFRFRNALVYEQWYKVKHGAPALSETAVYGLPEINRERIRDAVVVGNPGCYPTSALLALYPLVKEKLIDPQSIIIDSKSGVSGAGRTPAIGSLYTEAAEGIKAYNVGRHRHTPEIEQELSIFAGESVYVSFTPHLTPMIRGILTTAYATLSDKAKSLNLNQYYREIYAREAFIRVHPEGVWPQTKWVLGTNLCDIGVAADPRTNRVVVTTVIDNLVKGAAGQAVQNMNIIFGLPEKTGLEVPPLYP